MSRMGSVMRFANAATMITAALVIGAGSKGLPERWRGQV
jgi:hypothetical protein